MLCFTSVSIFSQKGTVSDDEFDIMAKEIDSVHKVNFPEGIKLCSKALQSAKDQYNAGREAEFTKLLGDTYYLQGDLKTAGTQYYKALKIVDSKNNSKLRAQIYNSLGRYYRKLNHHHRALKFYQQALNLYQEMADADGIATIYNESGVVYEKMGNYTEAIQRYKQSLQIQEKRKYLIGQGYSLEFIGGALIQLKKFNEAETYLQKALKVHLQTQDPFATAENHNFLGDLYKAQRKYKLAEEHYKKSNLFAVEKNYLDLMQNNYEKLAEIYRNSGNYYLAHSSQQLYMAANRKLFDIERIKQIEEMSFKYETAVKDKEISEKKNELYHRNVSIISLMVLLVLVSAGTWFYFLHRKKNEDLRLQKEILYHQDQAAKAVMEAEDNERKRMAIHLHDGVGQMLTATNMNLQVLEELRNDETVFQELLAKTKAIMNDAVQEVRTLSHQIMPNMLIRSTLGNALKELVAKIDSPKLHVSLKIDGLKDNLEDKIQIVMFRIIQESINNTIKHAKASQIHIMVAQTESLLETTFEDNGVGFDPVQKISYSEGMGLANIKSRIEMLQGELLIQSSPGRGTLINVKIPLNAAPIFR